VGSEPDPVVGTGQAKPRPVREWLLRRHLVQEAIASKADLSLFKRRPTVRLVVGVCLIAISYLVAWPSMAALTFFAAWIGRPVIAVVGAPALYGLSWVVWLVGVGLAGRESMHYGDAFGRWALRRFAERHLVGAGRGE
jgi:hypothetical protein